MIPVKVSDAGRKQEGFEHEKNDCSVRATAVRFTTSYKRAHEILESIGRKERHGIRMSHVRKLFEKMGIEPKIYLIRPTLNQFIKEHPKGRYYIVLRGHALGIINGICIDMVTPKLRTKVLISG